MKDEDMETRHMVIEEICAEIRLMEEEYKRTPEYRKERMRDRFLYFCCVVFLSFIVLMFVDVVIGLF